MVSTRTRRVQGDPPHANAPTTPLSGARHPSGQAPGSVRSTTVIPVPASAEDIT